MTGAALLLPWLLTYAGLAGFCFAMDRHHRQLRGCAPTGRARAMLRLAGVTGLIAGFGLCLSLWGGGLGSLAWISLLTGAGIPLILLLAATPAAALLPLLALPAALLLA